MKIKDLEAIEKRNAERIAEWLAKKVVGRKAPTLMRQIYFLKTY